MLWRLWPSRENRLLLLVVAVSAGALLLLSRFRFPGGDRPVNPAPAPLERLAARATFDDLASIVAQLQIRVAPSLLVLRVSGPSASEQPSAASPIAPPRGGPLRSRLALAVRIGGHLAVARLGPGDRVEGLVGGGPTPTLVAVDPVRMVGLVDTGAIFQSSSPIGQPSTPLDVPRYVAVAEATPGGPTLRPLFLGRTDPFGDPRWPRPLLALGGAGVTQPGSLIFSLDGNLEGLTVGEDRLPAMAPADDLLAAIRDLEQGRVAGGGDLGIDVADLTPALADATGATSGAIVTYVQSTGPAAGLLHTGDVVNAIDGADVGSAEQLVLQVARDAPGTAVRLGVTRRGRPLSVEVTSAATRAPSGGADAQLGLVLRSALGAGAQVLRVMADSAASEAGVRPGDLITDLDGTAEPRPASVEQAFARAPRGAFLLLSILRDTEHLVVAVRKP